MLKENADILDELQKIIDNHQNFEDDYNAILQNYSYKKMSIGDGIYGMYYPNKQLEKYFEYNGTLTNNENKKDFSYYFDKNHRLVLTERYTNGNLLNAILFYYYQDKIEVVWYCMKRKKINVVGEILYYNNDLIKFVESGDVIRKNNSFKEYVFNADNEYIKIKSYINYSNDKEIVMNSKMKKNNNI